MRVSLPSLSLIVTDSQDEARDSVKERTRDDDEVFFFIPSLLLRKRKLVHSPSFVLLYYRFLFSNRFTSSNEHPRQSRDTLMVYLFSEQEN